MKIKRVNQYKCDYCGKKGYSAGHMKSHEVHCTKNPNRKCRMCEKNGSQNDLQKLTGILPEPVYETYPRLDIDGLGVDTFKLVNKEEVESAIKTLRKESDGCPACILAALRQKKINVRATSFNFKAESEEFWSNYNDAHNEECW